jgi:hypothetical protein
MVLVVALARFDLGQDHALVLAEGVTEGEFGEQGHSLQARV